MARYHLHPETGEPGLCRAKRACPFGSLESEHYDSPEAARAAFEHSMEDRLFAARHSRSPRSGKQELVEKLLEDRLEQLPQGDGRRLLLTSVLARYAGVETPEEEARLQWALAESAGELHDLGRRDLWEAATWAHDVTRVGHNLDMFERERARERAMDELEERRLERRLQELHQEAQEEGFTLGVEVADPDYYRLRDKAAYFEQQLERVRARAAGNPEAEAIARQADSYRAEALARKKFHERPQRLTTGDRAFDGVNEFTFTTAEGEEATVRELLEASDETYAGRVSIAHGQALAVVQEQGRRLLKLLEDANGEFAFPRQLSWNREEDRAPNQEERDKLFPPREGFRLIGGGGEVNVYLHEPTQLVFKVPHGGSLIFGSARGDERQRVVKRGVQLVEDRYARVEGSLSYLKSEGVRGVDYLKTYFVSAPTSGGLEVPLVVQPKVDLEVYRPLDPHKVSYRDEEGRTQMLDGTLEEAGFGDLHGGNLFYNIKTGGVLLVDCLFVPDYERDADYHAQGLL